MTKGGDFGLGEENTAYEEYFIGKSYLNMLTDSDCAIAVANVTFEPGCRNNWHIHHAKKVEDKFYFVLKVKDGIRKKVKKHKA